MRSDEPFVTRLPSLERSLSRLPLPPLPKLPLPRLGDMRLPEPADVAARAVNALLAREQWARDRLLRHAGKTVRLAWRRSTIGLTIDSDGLVQPADAAIVPDVTVTVDDTRLTLAGLLSLRASGDEAVIIDATHISGEAGLAQVVGELARHLRFDVEDALAQRIGDIPATRLLRGLRAMSQGARQAGERIGQNVAEYLAEERHVVLGRPAFDAHRRAQAELDERLDALSAKIARMTRRDAGSASPPSGVNRSAAADQGPRGRG